MIKQVYTFTEWKAEVAKALALKGLTRKDLAKMTGYNYYYVTGICSGTVVSRPAIMKISEMLGIEPYVE